MIPTKIRSGKTPGWQKSLSRAIGRPGELLDELGLEAPTGDSEREAIRFAHEQFATRVPIEFAGRMVPGDIDDPLLKQVLPVAAEILETNGYSADPVGDISSHTGAGVLQKYHGRALLIASGACAVHCRYCFRRHFPYSDHHAATEHWQAAIDLIEKDSSISEVILSGGDPLSLADHKLEELVALLESIPHLRRLRIHTRYPVVLPSRVNDSLLAWLNRTRFPVAVVIHCNHAREIDEAVGVAIAKLASTGAQILNQSVLLKGINDNVDALCDLSETLFDIGVLPYYLHMLDPVSGAAHFAVGDAAAKSLIRCLRIRLPGYLVPSLVREKAGAASKTPV